MSSPRASTHASASCDGVDALLRRDRLDLRDELEVPPQVLFLEAGAAPSEVRFVQVVHRPDPAAEEAAPERAVRDEADPELAHGRKNLRLRVARPERVLGLKRRDRVDGVGAPDRRRRRLGEAEVAHLPLLHELRHRADRLLDRRLQVDPVLVVEVDRLDSETTERRLAGRANVRGAAVDAEELAVRAADVPELGRQHDAFAPAGNRLPDEPLVCAPTVRVGGVEERDPELERPVDRRDRLALVRAAVELGHAHAAEPKLRDLEPMRAQRPRVHRPTIPANRQQQLGEFGTSYRGGFKRCPAHVY